MTVPRTPRTLVNGEPETTIAVSDRGFALGDGLFETIAVRAGRAHFWNAHLERLADGCCRLAIPVPDTARLFAESEQARGASSEGTARITVTRGTGPRGYAPPASPQPNRVITFTPRTRYPETRPEGLVLRWCTTRLARQPALAGIKHLNRLEQVLARSEWSEPSIDEGVMLSMDGRVVECVSSNLFLLREAGLVTPAITDAGVKGVMRRQVLRAAEALDLDLEVRDVMPGELMEAAAVFITNAVRGIAPVARIGTCRYPTDDPRMQHLMQWLETCND